MLRQSFQQTGCGRHSQKLPKGHVRVSEILSHRETARDSNACRISPCITASNCGIRKPTCMDDPVHGAHGLFERRAHTTMSPTPYLYFKLHLASFRFHGPHVGHKSHGLHVELSLPGHGLHVGQTIYGLTSMLCGGIRRSTASRRCYVKES